MGLRKIIEKIPSKYITDFYKKPKEKTFKNYFKKIAYPLAALVLLTPIKYAIVGSLIVGNCDRKEEVIEQVDYSSKKDSLEKTLYVFND